MPGVAEAEERDVRRRRRRSRSRGNCGLIWGCGLMVAIMRCESGCGREMEEVRKDGVLYKHRCGGGV